MEYTDKTEVERLIIQENEWKYHQTDGSTDLLSQDFLDKLGQYEEGPEVDDVLNGTFESSKYFTSHNTVNEWNKFLLQILLMSVLHSLHISKHGNLERKRQIVSINIWVTIKQVLYMWSEIPVVTGYSCVDLMILKKAMNFDLSKQHTLGLLDTELNQYNKNLQREAIKVALQTKSVAPEQYS